jgi:hypothetical protein
MDHNQYTAFPLLPIKGIKRELVVFYFGKKRFKIRFFEMSCNSNNFFFNLQRGERPICPPHFKDCEHCRTPSDLSSILLHTGIKTPPNLTLHCTLLCWFSFHGATHTIVLELIFTFFSDVRIVASDGSSVKAHKSIISARCPHLAAEMQDKDTIGM